MKIAIISDWLVTFAGAERVLTELIHCFPEADLFAIVDFLKPEDRQLIQNKPIKTTFIQKMPFAKKYYRHYLPLMPLAIEQLDLSNYDLIISSSHAVAKGVITGPDQIHVSYVHTPIRYAWDLQHQYLQESGLNRGLKGFLAQYILHKIRLWDLRCAHGVDHFIANSKYIAKRIFKTYRRTAEVIHPPVNIDFFTPHSYQKENYYITLSRMVPYKKMDLIVESFAKMPDKKLIVIGDGPDFAKIKSKAKNSPQIELLGFQSNEIIRDYLQRAKAFVFAAEEDFGITLLEAQAAGTPIIAFGKGGALETIRGLSESERNPTGLFFNTQTVDAIIAAVNEFEKNSHLFTSLNCRKNAALFSQEHFRHKIKKLVNHVMEHQE